MLSFIVKATVVASCFFFHLKSISAAPAVEVVKVIQVRQADGGDDDGGAITNQLRNAYDYSMAFESSTLRYGVPTWYTISPFGAGGTMSGTYQSFTSGLPKPTPPPSIQAAQGTSFNIDHVLELQVVASFVQSANPNTAAIPDASWNFLRTVVVSQSNPPNTLVTPIAVALAQPYNLGAIPSKPNFSKQLIFQSALDGSTLISPQSSFIRDANRRYLLDRRGGIQASIVPGIATALGGVVTSSGGAQGPAVSTAISNAWRSYASSKYDYAITLHGGFGN